MVVSIDETHFRSDIAMNKRWQVKSVADSKVKHGRSGNIGVKRVRNHPNQKSNILAVNDEVINFGLQLLDGNANDYYTEDRERLDYGNNSTVHPSLSRQNATSYRYT